MDFRADVRVYCCGLCGEFVYFPFKEAQRFLTEEGGWAECVVRGHYCQNCIDYFNWLTEPLLLGDGR